MTEKIDRQDAFSGTKPVSDSLSFDVDALASYLAKVLQDFEGPLSVEQFKGGQSNPTYLLTATSGRYVLRRKPPGQLLPSAHAVDREYRVMKALAANGFPVPKVRALCDDDSIIGTMFYVMDFTVGRVIWEPHCPGLRPSERTAIYQALNGVLAHLHTIDIDELGLTDYGRAEGYVARQISRWANQYKASQTRDIAAMDHLMDWLPNHSPETNEARIVHGDFRLDNLILAVDRPDVLAVLDWELSTLGDPLADFTYHCMQWMMPPSADGSGVGSLLGHDLDALGIPRLDDYVAHYCARTGRANIPNLDTYLAYNFFRMAAIFQGIVGRVRDGTATNDNAAAMESQVEPMANTAWHFAERAGAR